MGNNHSQLKECMRYPQLIQFIEQYKPSEESIITLQDEDCRENWEIIHLTGFSGKSGHYKNGGRIIRADFVKKLGIDCIIGAKAMVKRGDKSIDTYIGSIEKDTNLVRGYAILPNENSIYIGVILPKRNLSINDLLASPFSSDISIAYTEPNIIGNRSVNINTTQGLKGHNERYYHDEVLIELKGKYNGKRAVIDFPQVLTEQTYKDINYLITETLKGWTSLPYKNPVLKFRWS